MGRVVEPTPAPGAPAVCQSLADVPGFADLPRLLGRLADGEPGAAADIQAVATALTGLAGGAGTLATPITAVAQALGTIATGGLTDPAITALEQALGSLDTEGRVTCGYPVG